MMARTRRIFIFLLAVVVLLLVASALLLYLGQSRPADGPPPGNNTDTVIVAGENATGAKPADGQLPGNNTGPINNTVIEDGGNATGMEPADGQSLGNYTRLFGNDTVIVAGENATGKELEGARQIRSGLANLTGNAPAIKTDANLSSLEKSDRNLILVGTPRTNRLVDEIYRINNKDIRAGYFNEYRDGPHNASYGLLLLFASPWAVSRGSPRHVLVVDGWDDDGIRSAALVLSRENLAGFNGAGIFVRWNGTSYAWYSTNEVTDMTVGSIASVYRKRGVQTYPEAHFRIINVTSRNSDWAVVIGTFDGSERYGNGTVKEQLLGTRTIIVTRNGEPREGM